MEVEAEASELTALLRCGNYSICVVRSDDLNRSNVHIQIDKHGAL
jgi:hypothetical protein